MISDTHIKISLEALSDLVKGLEQEIEELLVKGDAYRWGNEEVEPDLQLAIEYYHEAAELGDWEAMVLLADLLEELGRGDEAAQWRQRRDAAMGAEGMA